MSDKAEHARRMALVFERKANEASASDAPWWKGNLRTYQNHASEWWRSHFAALKEKETV